MTADYHRHDISDACWALEARLQHDIKDECIQIDTLIYKLYELTDKEIQIVRGTE